jgi:glycerol kinase
VSAAHLLALDLGTTGVRALVVDAEGRVLGRAYRSLGVRHPEPGRVEQDPEEMWQGALAVLRAALADAALDPRDVAGLGVATQRSTVVAWDSETRRPLCPAIGWQDQRTEDLVAAHRARGLPINTLASATKYEWWLQHEPAVAAAAAAGRLRFGNPDAWLSDRLTAGAAFVTDPGQASCTALYDLGRGCWSPALLGFFGVAADTLPEIRATSEVVGETVEALLGAPIPLAARAGDQQAASFAHGVFETGDAKLTLGTSAMLDVHTGDAPGTAEHGVIPMALWRLAGAGDAYCIEGQVLTAGAVIEWLVALGIISEPSAVDRIAAQAETAEGVVFVPALQGLGTPWSDTAARGLIGGLTRGSNAAHLTRAALEGIAQRCVDVCDAVGLDDRPLRVDGGLARSRLLLQSLADLGGRPLAPAVEPETTALGAAKLAGLAVGTFASPRDCIARVPEPVMVAPRIGSSERRERRRRWRECVVRAHR